MDKTFAEKVAEAKAAVESVDAQRAGELEKASGVTFVDPRPASAIASTTGIIPSALNVALSDIAEGKLPAVLSERSAPIITACQGGPMGAIAAHELLKQGFTQVRYLEGGTQAWLDAGFPTTR